MTRVTSVRVLEDDAPAIIVMFQERLKQLDLGYDPEHDDEKYLGDFLTLLYQRISNLTSPFLSDQERRAWVRELAALSIAFLAKEIRDEKSEQ